VPTNFAAKYKKVNECWDIW